MRRLPTLVTEALKNTKNEWRLLFEYKYYSVIITDSEASADCIGECVYLQRVVGRLVPAQFVGHRGQKSVVWHHRLQRWTAQKGLTWKRSFSTSSLHLGKCANHYAFTLAKEHGIEFHSHFLSSIQRPCLHYNLRHILLFILPKLLKNYILGTVMPQQWIWSS